MKTIIDEIRRDDHRATEVIRRLRRLLRKSAIEAQNIDLNETVREVFEFLAVQAAARDVTLSSRLAQGPLRVSGDRVQLQQVILNLVVNGMESMVGATSGRREVTSSTSLDEAWAEDLDSRFRPRRPVGQAEGDIRAVLYHEAGRYGHGAVHCPDDHRVARRLDFGGKPFRRRRVSRDTAHRLAPVKPR